VLFVDDELGGQAGVEEIARIVTKIVRYRAIGSACLVQDLFAKVAEDIHINMADLLMAQQQEPRHCSFIASRFVSSCPCI
jgi:hypothetical protein